MSDCCEMTATETVGWAKRSVPTRIVGKKGGHGASAPLPTLRTLRASSARLDPAKCGERERESRTSPQEPFDEHFDSSAFTAKRYRLRRRVALLTRFGTPVGQARRRTC